MIAQFALRLMFGMSLMWAVMPRSQVTTGFFRIQMLVVLGLSVLALLSMGQLADRTPDDVFLAQTPGRVLCGIIAGCVYVGSVVWTLGRQRAGAVFVFLIALLAPVTLLLSTLTPATIRTTEGLLFLASELSTSAMLGGTVTSMLLGHWYLTAPTMSIAPLSRLNTYLGIATVVRLLLSVVALVIGWKLLHGPTHQIWLGLRWLAGILGPGVAVVLTWRILRYRNTQSATGVLFVAVILSFIGELMATLLYWETGIAY